ncbi:GNAT family N-acetyltransferase [Paenibacillus sp. XY044]|uniref:GNAT family N-acetyltransferase n=1 Tax=Paenibacillus sp. XY044 TaxID=2026089 RepID=UPI000B991C50|nr:GNAT family N-acetyltransferase [Paenibacillus sp. XY044]OZB92805.1 N-acetyltransferase [Paenibacillus sp. XY044]
MDIQIREMTDRDRPEHIQIDGSFTVDSELVLSATDQRIGYTIKPVPSYSKSYPDEADQGDDGRLSEYIGSPDRAVYLAMAGDRVVGRIMLARNWNRYAFIEDLRVDRNVRGHGIGRKLIEQAVHWAKSGDMPGLMLETQNNNVRACQFYESCGFVIGGFDSNLYRGFKEHAQETALFWYLLF